MIIKSPRCFSQYWDCWLHCFNKFKSFMSHLSNFILQLPEGNRLPCICLPMQWCTVKSGTFHPRDGNIQSRAKEFLHSRDCHLSTVGGHWRLGNIIFPFTFITNISKPVTTAGKYFLCMVTCLKSLRAFLFSNDKC